jgi:intracellular sulfur oxidation DsrE/DsrF family protein
MKKMPLVAIILAATLTSVPALADNEPQIHIDVPVTIKSAKIVFNMDHAAFNGDTPIGIKHMSLVLQRFHKMGGELNMVGVFHSDAGYMLLNNETYNKVRKTTTGNPYAPMIEDLIKNGVQIEECAVTMKGNGWGNENLLPNVKVDTGAIGRIVQLEQNGYIMIQP